MGRSGKYIIGAGVAGAVHSFYNGGTLIDSTPAGQVKGPYNLGPRLLEDTPETRLFCKRLGLTKLKYVTAKIGYKQDGHIFNYMPEGFAKTYAYQSRGVRSIESSFLSSGRNELKIITHPHLDIYDLVVQSMLAKAPILKGTVVAVDMANKTLSIDTQENIVHYSELVNTIRLDKFQEIAGLEPIAMPLVNKSFKIINRAIDDNPDDYAYIYSIDGDYTRKTFNQTYAVLENSHPFETGNYVTLPIQLSRSYNLRNVGDVRLVGRYARIAHKTTLTTLIQQYEKNI